MILPGVILGHIEVKASKSMSSLGFIVSHKCEPPYILIFVIFNFFRIYYILHFRVSSVIKLYVHENNVMMTS
jgi:hypothetical protein